jgi:hypothetical protein
MQDCGYVLPRMPLLLGTWVNKGKKKGQGAATYTPWPYNRKSRHAVL